MIAYLKGILIHKSPGQVIIDTGGVGYRATIPLSTYFKLGEVREPVELLIYSPFSASPPRKRRTCSSSSSGSPGSAPSWP